VMKLSERKAASLGYRVKGLRRGVERRAGLLRSSATAPLRESRRASERGVFPDRKDAL
jgi:hypothetical protein